MGEKQQHIAILRLSAMGDVAMLVPAVQVLRASYPELKITVVSKAFHKPIFAAIPDVSFLAAEVKGKHKGILGMCTLAKELKALGVTHLADCHNVLRSKMVRSFMSFSGVKRSKMDKDRAAKKALCKPNNKTWKPLKSSHQRYAEVLGELGFPVDLNQFVPLDRGVIPQAALELLQGWTGKILGIAPYAAFGSKSYSEEQMREVLEQLDQSNELKTLLFGGPSERESLLKLASGLKHVEVVAGLLKFPQELDLISNLDGMLAMDSGNGHLAANFGLPVFTIWGVTHPYLGFAPFGQNETNWLLPDLEKYPAIPTSVYGKDYPSGYENAINSIPSQQVSDLVLKNL
ncbi:glycosyltransferase family 9 protein [Gilvibacter sediminis]|uniref:glycosyltransferase family 9 protein n=1 Tax=Gilvibacter sediminis TaxID=379071 RepID=UPI002350F317|nr:glycosyltransferase family 9 protein [Gilvibacter sediminis]MDC7996772.1 glycosyltransferase family 9 protein [Gilvibacter sediminis]